MHIKVTTTKVHYRLRGKPVEKLRARIFVDDIAVGSFVAAPDLVYNLLELLALGQCNDGRPDGRYDSFTLDGVDRHAD